MPARALSFITAVASLLACATAGIAHAQCLTTQSCLTVHSPGGCDSLNCCLAVCTIDPTCCTASWDAGCVAFANDACVGYCGAAASGSCFAPHSNPSCDVGACCAAVCVIDPFCCATTWDFTCAQTAGFACPGNPGTCGVTPDSCYVPHTQGACNDTSCCNAVCSIDPTCCSQSWDALCVFTAEEICPAGCIPTAELNAQVEVESCDERYNDPCYVAFGGKPEVLAPGVQVIGGLGRSPSSLNGADVDVYAITLPDPDGDGLAKVELRFASSPTAWAALVPGSSCAAVTTSVLHAASSLCVDTITAQTCVPAGAYRLVVSGGTYPSFGGGDIVCLNSNKYTLQLLVAQNCVACATNGPSCFVPHQTGGCNLPACCTAVCASDPFCCDAAWDSDCVAVAATQCVTAPPSNDTCSGATPIGVGDARVFNSARANLEAAQPTGCVGGVFARDVWFVYDADSTGVLDIQTCGSWFDTVLAVYQGTCKGLVQVACSDNDPICGGVNASRLDFDAVCGERYYFRVGPKSGQGGEATLRLLNVQAIPCPNCPEDLNGSGAVDAQDITILLNGWGQASGDITGDGTTNAQDIAALLNAWGPCP
jgi:hypothetical protein